MVKKKRAREVLRRLKRTYKVRGPFVHWKNPLQLVIATVLSAQCTDKVVNKVTKKLFKKYKTPHDYAAAKLKTLENEIYKTGFYRSKAKYLKSIGRRLNEEYGGKVPAKLDDLLTLPGVSFKTAHLVMAKAFGQPTGIAVDTHVSRVAPRLGLTKQKNPKKMGDDLEKLYPSNDYLEVNEYFITHGRAICRSKPDCVRCPLQDICPSATTFLKKRK